MATPTEVAAMRRALELAQSPDAPTGPNPRVGCVLLRPDGSTLAEGYHRGAGAPHAEVDALNSAGQHARGATAVVTLEPCNHTGRTGPCVAALREAGVARVVFGQPDTSPVARGGAEVLRTAGVDVEGGVLADAARAVNPIWTFAVENGRPYVTWKYAATLDGRSAAADGTSQWITSPEARADVHRLRAECDAILVGTGTVLSDNPWLTAREVSGRPLDRDRQPLRAVMGLREIPADAAVRDDAAGTLHLETRDPDEALKRLLDHDRQHVLLEGGPTLAGAFWRADLVERVIAYVAPMLLGAGTSALGDAGIGTIGDAARLVVTDVTRVGPDVRLIAKKG
ncbi:MAG TPA: bifunctional diaminohydroxyphosphoribosylaminopyrimidine deaminase/5-amino-6-(5-phosphoribosylamino)uracil reductase RibD [Jiangellaceae bacterium]